MVYGAPLTVPGDFIPSNDAHPDNKLQLQRLRDQVRSLAPIPISQHGAIATSIPRDLQQAKFVFIRRDAHRTPLQRHYEGPFRVIQAGSKTFEVDIGGKTGIISVDRLKPAHLDLQSLPEVQPRSRTQPLPKPITQHQAPNSPHRTRSGRQVKLPQRFIQVLGGEWCSSEDSVTPPSGSTLRTR